MSHEIIIVLVSLVGMLAALIADKMRPGMILFSVFILRSCNFPMYRNTKPERDA